MRDNQRQRKSVWRELSQSTCNRLRRASRQSVCRTLLDQAEPHLRESLEKSRRVLGDDHMDTLGAILNLGGLLRARGKFEEAEPYAREALERAAACWATTIRPRSS